MQLWEHRLYWAILFIVIFHNSQMKVIFVKNCPWLLDGKLIKFLADTMRDVPNKDAGQMIRHGYAEEVLEPVEQVETGETGETGERYAFYKENYTRSSLQELCREQIPAYRTNAHRNIDEMIKLILEHEKANGQLEIEEKEHE